MTSFRAVRPAAACAAASSAPRYASTSTMRPATFFLPSRRTMILPSSSGQTSRGSRLKNSRATSLPTVLFSATLVKRMPPTSLRFGGLLCARFFLLLDPVIDVGFQNVERQRAGAEHHVVKRLQIELRSQLIVSPVSQLLDF